MKPIPWALPAMAAGAVAWHAFWWGLVRIETVTPVARAAPPPLQLLIESGDNPITTQGLIRSPVLFALPYGPGFSRYLNRAEDARPRPAEELPDLTLLAERPRAPLAGQVVLVPEAGTVSPLDHLPAPPGDPEAGSSLGSKPMLLASLHPEGTLSDTLREELSRLSAAAWSCSARLEVGGSGTVDHVFLEQVSGLPATSGATLSAVLRRISFPPGPIGRLAWAHLAHPGGGGTP